jgi:hypothetical protein
MAARLSLIALATMFAFAAFAQAAEKPVRKAQKPDRNRACAAQGEGFVYSRESDACIRVGGSVTGDFSTGTPANR